MLSILKLIGLPAFQSITRKSLPATTRRKTNTPAPASLAFDDGDTPRNILRNILLTGVWTCFSLDRVAVV